MLPTFLKYVKGSRAKIHKGNFHLAEYVGHKKSWVGNTDHQNIEYDSLITQWSSSEKYQVTIGFNFLPLQPIVKYYNADVDE